MALQAGMGGGSFRGSPWRNFIFLSFVGPKKTADEGAICLCLSQIDILTF